MVQFCRHIFSDVFIIYYIVKIINKDFYRSLQIPSFNRSLYKTYFFYLQRIAINNGHLCISIILSPKTCIKLKLPPSNRFCEKYETIKKTSHIKNVCFYFIQDYRLCMVFLSFSKIRRLLLIMTFYYLSIMRKVSLKYIQSCLNKKRLIRT